MSNKTKLKAPKGLLIVSLIFTAIAILAGLGLTVLDTINGLDLIKAGLANIKSAEFLVAVSQIAKLAIYAILLIVLIVVLAKHNPKGSAMLPFLAGGLLMLNVVVSIITLGWAGEMSRYTEFVKYFAERLLKTNGFLLVWAIAIVVAIFAFIAAGTSPLSKGKKVAMSLIALILFDVGFGFFYYYLCGMNTDAVLEAFMLYTRDLSKIISEGDAKAYQYIGIMGYEAGAIFVSMVFAFIVACATKEAPAEEVAAPSEKAEEPKEEKKEEAAPVASEPKAEEQKEEPKAEEPKEEPKAEEAPATEEAKEEKTEDPKGESEAEESQSRWNLGKAEETNDEPEAEEAAPDAKEEAKADEAPTITITVVDPGEPTSPEEPEEKPTAKKAPAKKAAPKKTAEDLLTLKGKTYHVVKRMEDGVWSIKANKGQKALKLFPNKVEALKYAETLEAKGATVLVHASKGANAGKIQKH